VPTRQIPIAELRKGDRIEGSVLLVEMANFKQTRNNKNFIQLQLRDRTASVKAVRWEASHELFASFESEGFVRISGRVEEFQQKLQVVVDRLEPVPADEVDSDQFLPTAERDIAEMEAELHGCIATVRDEHLRALLLSIVEDPALAAGLRRCPAGKAMHHAYVGGLLEHTLSLINAGQQITKVYPELNGDILTAAAILHDIGKVRELSYDRAFQYTDEGQLVGHIGIGIVLVSEKANAIAGFPQELLQHVLHIIASHHGILEHGALKLPMTPEAIAFHYLDNLDAKLATLRGLRQELEQTGAVTAQERKWTEYKPALGRRILFP
jgi:3'-5' exoribonuclease